MTKIVGKRVSFDFDGTLDDEFDGFVNQQKHEIQKVCKELLENNEVFIITKRYGPNHKEAAKVYTLASALGIKQENIHFTNRDLKYLKIKELNIDVHFENEEYECYVINRTVECVTVVPVEDPYWKDLVY